MIKNGGFEMENTIRKNEKCFIGMPSCGYGYESAKLCFVACPSNDKYALKIDVIKDIIESKRYECHIALKRIDPGNFAFCTKICSKIIQSQFCIVLLDPSPDNTNINEFPNPNVHFEYGMMTCQNKYIIPLQDEKYNLAFNIFPLDTIKYNDSNFKIKITEAVNNAIARASEKKVTGPIPQGKEILTYYTMKGFRFSEISIDFFRYLYSHGSNLGFFLFDSNKESKYKFFGPFDYEDPKKAIINTQLLIDSLVSRYKELVSIIKNDNKLELSQYEYLKRDISIDIIIPPFYEKEEIKSKIDSIVDKEYIYQINVYYRSDINDYVNNKYKEIGNLTVIKPPLIS